MDCNSIPLHSPYFWTLFASGFLGASLSRMTMPTRDSINPARARGVKWALVCVYLSVMVSFGMVAVFIPGPHKILDIRLLFYFLAAACIFFLAFRFKRFVGIPVALVLLVAFFLFYTFLHYWNCPSEDGIIGEFRPIRKEPSELELVVYYEGVPSFLTVSGASVKAAIISLSIADYYLLGAEEQLYRFYGFLGDGERRSAGEDNSTVLMPAYKEVMESKWYQFLSDLVFKLPGITMETRESVSLTPVLFQKYSIMFLQERDKEVDFSSSERNKSGRVKKKGETIIIKPIVESLSK